MKRNFLRSKYPLVWRQMCSGAWVWDRVYHKPIVRDVTPCSSDVFRQENYYSGYARGLRCKSGLVCLGFFLTQNRDSCAIVLRHILPSLNPLWFHAYSFIPKCQLREGGYVAARVRLHALGQQASFDIGISIGSGSGIFWTWLFIYFFWLLFIIHLQFFSIIHYSFSIAKGIKCVQNTVARCSLFYYVLRNLLVKSISFMSYMHLPLRSDYLVTMPKQLALQLVMKNPSSN